MLMLEIVCSIDPKAGGVSAGLCALAEERATHGQKTTVISLDAPEAFTPDKLPFDWVGLGPSLGKYHYTPRLIPWLLQHAKAFDAITIHGIWQWHSFGAWQALRTLGLPYLVFTHGMLAPWFKRTYPLKHFKKWLYWPWSDYRVLRDADAVCFTTDEERQLAKKSFWLYAAQERICGFGISDPPAATEEQKAAFTALVPASANKRIALFLSRIAPVKGCDILIKAFALTLAKKPDWHLVIAGPDQFGLAKSLQHLAAKLGIAQQISWPGMLMGDAKWGAFRSAEIFCLPTHHENFGVVVPEALACGCPVLISDQINIYETIATSNVGLVAPDTLDGFVGLLNQWSNLSSEEANGFRNKCVDTFKRHFHISAASAQLNTIIEGINKKREEKLSAQSALL
jgi:glycosyltransferase involved in cell wall biosynthesis